MYYTHTHTHTHTHIVLCHVMFSHGRQVKRMRAESEKSDVDESSSLLKVCEGE